MKVKFKRKWVSPNVEAAHATLHIVKAAGKLAGACDDLGHGREAMWVTTLADVIISAHGLADILGIEWSTLEAAIAKRLLEKNA